MGVDRGGELGVVSLSVCLSVCVSLTNYFVSVCGGVSVWGWIGEVSWGMGGSSVCLSVCLFACL